MKKINISRILHGYRLLMAVVLFVFVTYKLGKLSWFANATVPTLVVYGFIVITILLLLYKAVIAFFQNKKR